MVGQDLKEVYLLRATIFSQNSARKETRWVRTVEFQDLIAQVILIDIQECMQIVSIDLL